MMNAYLINKNWSYNGVLTEDRDRNIIQSATRYVTDSSNWATTHMKSCVVCDRIEFWICYQYIHIWPYNIWFCSIFSLQKILFKEELLRKLIIILILIDTGVHKTEENRSGSNGKGNTFRFVIKKCVNRAFYGISWESFKIASSGI